MSEDNIIFRTPRAISRPMVREDIDKRCEWGRFDNPLLGYYNITLPRGNLRDKLYNKWNVMKRLWFSCDLTETGELAAMISLREIRKFRKTSRLGIVLNPRYTDQGLGTELVQGLMEYYFTEMNFRILYLDVARFNSRARRCYDKCGFEVFGDFWREYDGSYTVTMLPEFREQKKNFSYRQNRLFTHYDDMKMTREHWLHINAERGMRSAEEGMISK